MNKGPKWFKVHGSDYRYFSGMSCEDVGRAFMGALRYFNTGEEPNDLGAMARAGYEVLKYSVEESYYDYIQKVNAGKQGAERRWGNDGDDTAHDKVLSFDSIPKRS